MIPVFRPAFGEDEFAAVKEAMASGWVGLGPKTQEFEERFAEYVGARYAVGVNSGTAALHLALLAHGVGPGDEVIAPSLTFISTVHAIKFVGATPVLADVHPDTLCMDPDDVARKLTGKTRALLPVHYGGHPCDMEELLGLAESRGILVVEDAAHAAGAVYRTRRVGSIGDATCFSFHAVKNLAMGEGGCITTDDPAINASLRKLRWMGISKDTYSRSSDSAGYSWYYEVSELGYKAHLSDIPASIGLVQLRRLDDLNGRRRELVSRYNAGLRDTEWLQTPVLRDNVTSACHNYVVKTPYRNQLNVSLQEKGIATGVHYMPAHLHPYYKDSPADLPVTDRVWETLLTLPLYPDLTNDEVDYIVETITSSPIEQWRGVGR